MNLHSGEQDRRLSRSFKDRCLVISGTKTSSKGMLSSIIRSRTMLSNCMIAPIWKEVCEWNALCRKLKPAGRREEAFQDSLSWFYVIIGLFCFHWTFGILLANEFLWILRGLCELEHFNCLMRVTNFCVCFVWKFVFSRLCSCFLNEIFIVSRKVEGTFPLLVFVLYYIVGTQLTAKWVFFTLSFCPDRVNSWRGMTDLCWRKQYLFIRFDRKEVDDKITTEVYFNFLYSCFARDGRVSSMSCITFLFQDCD